MPEMLREVYSIEVSDTLFIREKWLAVKWHSGGRHCRWRDSRVDHFAERWSTGVTGCYLDFTWTGTRAANQLEPYGTHRPYSPLHMGTKCSSN
jgi:hypothetical protein